MEILREIKREERNIPNIPNIWLDRCNHKFPIKSRELDFIVLNYGLNRPYTWLHAPPKILKIPLSIIWIHTNTNTTHSHPKQWPPSQFPLHSSSLSSALLASTRQWRSQCRRRTCCSANRRWSPTTRPSSPAVSPWAPIRFLISAHHRTPLSESAQPPTS